MPTNTELTISVPAAGKRLAGLSRNGSYAAVKRGELPVIKIGRLLRVPLSCAGANNRAGQRAKHK